MKKLLFIIPVILLSILSAAGRDQEIRDIGISVTLLPNGDAVVHETWDVNTGDRITEWYLVRDGLGDIEITDFTVFDGDEELKDTGDWNVSLTREEKAGKYGILRRADGLDLCWGIGEYGDHVYHAIYVMERVVKSLQDYDMLQLQAVPPGRGAAPQHVRVTVKATDVRLDTTNTRLWVLGYAGTATFQDGAAVFESTGPLGTDDSLIPLLRFDKGLFISPSVQDRVFQEVLDTATADNTGSKEPGDSEKEDFIITVISIAIMALLFLLPFLKGKRAKAREDYGPDIRK